MSKKSIISAVAGGLTLVGLVLVVIGFLLGGATNGYYLDNDGLHAIIERNGETEMVQNLGNFENIDITMSGKIELIKSDKNAIEYELFSGEVLDVCEVRNGTFTFKTKSRISIFSMSFKSSNVKLYYDGNTTFNNVSLKTISGSIAADGLNAKRVYAKSSSGSRQISNLVSDELIVDGTSGSIKVNDINSGKIELRGVSGSVTGDNITCNSILGKNTSGGTNITNLTTASTDIRSNSGSIKLQGALSGETYVSNISGRVQINSSLPKSDYGFNLSSTSGSCNVDGEKLVGRVGSEKPNQIEVKTTSGGINISFNE